MYRSRVTNFGVSSRVSWSLDFEKFKFLNFKVLKKYENIIHIPIDVYYLFVKFHGEKHYYASYPQNNHVIFV